MARRILEAELLANHGIASAPMGPGKSVEILKEFRLHKTYNGVFSLRFNYSGEVFAVGFGAGGIQIYETKTGNMMKELRACRQGGFAVMALNFHPKEPDILYASSTDGCISIYNIESGLLLATIEETGNEINTLDFCLDGYNFATGGKDLVIRIYETKTNKLVKTFEGYSETTFVMDKTKIGNTMRVFCIKFHPNNQFIFISGGWDNHVKIWDVRDADGIKRNFIGPHVCGDSIDILDNNILTGQWTALRALQEFNYTTGLLHQEIKFPNTEGAFLYAAQYCNKNTVIAGGSGTNRAEVIEIGTNRVIGGCQLSGAVHCADSAQNGRLLVTGGAASSFVLMKMSD
ncbi:guanine nucleotide-binding protein subunit beta-5b-like [Physella acuta]|uniref:guanine nucleotide-binding protein subunit beta-5b-like n=1 Tax=Physella acuta TaxID=109671 RepID=UPI0027DAFB86|nr:guanine nucleotide-binding protein subunit beta-5b-like [Physella acuta]XP_059163844.1 guanine nucleotide-binding protein subunit beta-5b-like [Physella acuta]XP_059163846.1 guanine nucleotide-binding protein subunit beta-5b-like [Physella acuta]